MSLTQSPSDPTAGSLRTGSSCTQGNTRNSLSAPTKSLPAQPSWWLPPRWVSLQDPLGVFSFCFPSSLPILQPPRAGRREALAIFQSVILIHVLIFPHLRLALGNEDVENLPSSFCQACYVKKMLITTKKSRKAAAGAGIEDGGVWSLPPFLLVGVGSEGVEVSVSRCGGKGDP